MTFLCFVMLHLKWTIKNLKDSKQREIYQILFFIHIFWKIKNFDLNALKKARRYPWIIHTKNVPLRYTDASLWGDHDQLVSKQLRISHESEQLLQILYWIQMIIFNLKVSNLFESVFLRIKWDFSWNSWNFSKKNHFIKIWKRKVVRNIWWHENFYRK